MNEHTMIIAEAGVNHNGDIALAKELVHAAAEAKADYIKFQTFDPHSLVTAGAKQAQYQQHYAKEADASQLKMLQKVALPTEAYAEIQALCKKCRIGFLSSPFDLHSIDVLAQLNMDFWKVPSGELTNLPYLRKIASTHNPILLSTGMSTLPEIEWALNVLLSNGVQSLDDITVLHCNTQYPTPPSDVNLRAMLTIHNTFGVKIGYSDHTIGIEIPIAAVSLGAVAIEKHFTINRLLRGPDHKASIEPNELSSMVHAIRNVETALGTGTKTATISERENIAIVRKSIVASRDIEAGTIFTEKNITVKRPGTGISPMFWDQVIGKTAKRNFSADEFIEL